MQAGAGSCTNGIEPASGGASALGRCQRFLERLHGELPDLAWGLPTEAQWEYACRAGTQTARYEATLGAIAWYGSNSQNTTQAVAQKRPNAWGLYDMLGNVWEWCHDGRRPYTRDGVVDPMGPTAAGADRALRGGGWLFAARFARAALRDAFLGFRAASSGIQEQA